MNRSSMLNDAPIALIIDDEKSICEALGGVLSDENWNVEVAHNGKDGIQQFVRVRPDIVFLDVWMTGMDGIETLQRLKEINSEVPIVIMSGHSTIETAVKATKLGAFQFLEKPLSLDKILPMLEHAKELQQGRIQKPAPQEEAYRLIGENEGIVRIRRQIEMVAPRNAWVLITGENGTGKEIVARNIHRKSVRANKPFVAMNCAAIPEELIESELFGHTKGAFTNAIGNKKGRFESAHQGTLFLDEIGDMSLKTQAKILRILQEQNFERVGSTETIEVDVRVIAATNKDLKEEIAQGNFREDLYYRLNVVPFHMPPLRERGDDVILMAEHFLDQMARELGEGRKQLTEAARRVFKAHTWPGNVRELKNLLERISIIHPEATIDAADVENLLGDGSEARRTAQKQSFRDTATLKQAKEDFERAFILDKLEENQWNVSKTAEAIGLERSNLHKKLKAYEIDPKRLKG